MEERELNEQILQETLAIEQAAEEAMEMQMMQDMMWINFEIMIIFDIILYCLYNIIYTVNRIVSILVETYLCISISMYSRLPK